MNKIKIFVAGATDLIREREALKIMVSDLNSQKNDADAIFTLYSYELFNDDQNLYNKFIQEEADIVIFVLDGCIGDKTEQEFIKASDAYKTVYHPEIMVFLKDANAKTEEIGKIKGLMAGLLNGNKYYVEYKDTDDLSNKVKDRLLRFAKDFSDKQKKIALNKKTTIKDAFSSLKFKFRRNFLIAGLIGVIAILTTFLFIEYFSRQKLLIFAGGGSVKNYIQNTRGVDIFDYPNSVYCHLASGTAWALLIEEANRTQEDKGRLERFTSICLSADNIDSTSFINEKSKGIFKKSRIVRYNIGSDTLMIYIHNSIIQNLNINCATKYFPVDSLRSLIKLALKNPDNYRIFSTSKTSGTLRIFQSCFFPTDSINLESMLNTEQSFLFYKDSESTYINSLDIPNSNKPYIILCSQHYHPETLENSSTKNFKKFFIVNQEAAVTKPMNLYFLAFYDNKERDCYKIRSQVFDFLKSIKAYKNISPQKWDNLKHHKILAEDGDLIINLN